MSDRLQRLAEAVHDETTFVEFLRALQLDWQASRRQEESAPSSAHEAAANGWENASVGAFLESAASWADDSKEGFSGYVVPDNPWQRCAQIMLMGKIYE